MSSSEEENTKKRARKDDDDHPDNSGDDDYDSDDKPQKKQKKSTDKTAKRVAAPPAKKQKKADDEKEWPLGPKRKVTISEFKGTTLVNIREYWTDASGEEKPGKKGISLTVDQWKNLAAAVDGINEAIKDS